MLPICVHSHMPSSIYFRGRTTCEKFNSAQPPANHTPGTCTPMDQRHLALVFELTHRPWNRGGNRRKLSHGLLIGLCFSRISLIDSLFSPQLQKPSLPPRKNSFLLSYHHNTHQHFPTTTSCTTSCTSTSKILRQQTLHQQHYTSNTTPATLHQQTLHQQHCTSNTTLATLYQQHYTSNTILVTLYQQYYTSNTILAILYQ